MRWTGHAARMGAKSIAYRILVGKPEGKRPLRRPRRRCMDIIKMNVREIGWGGMDWIELARYRDQWRALVNTVINLLKLKLNSVAFSPQANYTDRVTASCFRS
jgi:hypothetical protein